MRAVLQRVSEARVEVAGEVVGRIGPGLCVLVGVAGEDGDADAHALAEKLVKVRCFEDSEGKMNRSVIDIGGAILAISQFTLLGDLRSGNRPSFGGAMQPETAARLFDLFCTCVRRLGVSLETGRFRAKMRVYIVNEGPVTLMLDSKKAF